MSPVSDGVSKANFYLNGYGSSIGVPNGVEAGSVLKFVRNGEQFLYTVSEIVRWAGYDAVVIDANYNDWYANTGNTEIFLMERI